MSHKRVWLILAAWSALAVPAMAQVRVTIGDDGQPQVPENKDAPTGVTVPDSPGAVERLDKAAEKEIHKDWKTAAGFYAEALNQYAGRVVPVKIDKKAGTFQYSGIAPLVLERIAKWPPEGQTAYRNLYGRTAADQLAAVEQGDLAGVQKVFWTYFATDAGKAAGIRLIDLYTDSGDFTAAAFIADRLVTLHPALGGDGAAVRYRAAVAFYRAGFEGRARAILADAKTGQPQTVSLGGKDWALAEAIEAVLSRPRPTPVAGPTDADTWPTFGGRGGRGEPSTSGARLGAILNSTELVKPDMNQMPGGRNNLQAADKSRLQNYQAMGIMPVVDGGALFFQDGRNIYAVDADTGQPLPGWLSTYPGDRMGRYHLNLFGRASGEQLTITATPTAVLAILGQPDRSTQNLNQFMFNQPQQQTSIKMVCLDRETGRAVWSKSPSDLPESAAAVKNGDFSGTPLVVPGRREESDPDADDSVIAVVRGSKDNQFDDCYVVCLSLKTGKYRWSTFVGSALRSYAMDGSTSRDPSQVALADGRLVVMSNLGTVASLDPVDGRIVWLSAYSRTGAGETDPMAVFRGRIMRNNGDLSAGPTVRPWTSNPVVVRDGKVFALPADDRELFVYDASNGAELKRISTADFNNADVLLGVRGGIAYVNGPNTVSAIDWANYDPRKTGDPRAQANIAPAIGNARGTSNEICGRGFLTNDSVYVATREKLYQLRLDSGESSDGRRQGPLSVAMMYPANGQFNKDQGPGNIIATSQNLIIAGQTRVDVYTDLKLVQTKFEKQIADAPGDPGPRVRYADALFAGGATDQAIAQIDLAIDSIGGRDHLTPGRGRQTIYRALIDFAARAKSNKGSDGEKLADQMFDRAAFVADSPVERANYRLARGADLYDRHYFAQDLALCQEVLADSSQRNAAVNEEQTGGEAAKVAIDQVIAMDRRPYAPIEAKAADALSAAADADSLLEVAYTYPNSKSAITARESAAKKFEDDGNMARAIAVLKDMYAGTFSTDAKVVALTGIANDWLAMPDGLGPAADRLASAARISNGHILTRDIKLPDGTVLKKNTNLADALDVVRKLHESQAASALPDLKLGPPAMPDVKVGPPAVATAPTKPFVQTISRPVIENVTLVLHPVPGYERHDMLLTWSPGGVAIFKAGSTTPLAVARNVAEQPIAAAWVGDKCVVWTPARVTQFGVDGKPDWTQPVDSLPEMAVTTGNVVIDQEPTPDEQAQQQQAMINGGVIIRRGIGRVRAMNAAVGVVPQPPQQVEPVVGPEQITSAIPAGRFVVVGTSIGRVWAIRLDGGNVAWQSRPAERSPDQLLGNGQYAVARIDQPTGALVVVYESKTGKVVGRRQFGAADSMLALMNVALSEDATLVFTQFGKVTFKDLYDPWKTKPLELTSARADTLSFTGLTQRDQLVAADGRIVALFNLGAFIKVIDLSTLSDPAAPAARVPLSTTPQFNANQLPLGAAHLRVVGPDVYACHQAGYVHYNLYRHDDWTFGTVPQVDRVGKVKSAIIARDDLVLVNDPSDMDQDGSSIVELVFYNRRHRPDGHEDGRLEYLPVPLRKMTSKLPKITDFLPVDGGLYYLSADSKLHYCAGAAAQPPTTQPTP